MDYNSASELLASGRTRDSRERRKVANNTYLERRDPETIALRLHATDVLTFTPDGVTLNTGGWMTPTTKDRLNSLETVRIYSDKGVWYVAGLTVGPDGHRRFDDSKVVRYFDGLRLDNDGNPLNPLPEEETKRLAREERRIKAQIKTYLAQVSRALKNGLPDPGPGDCWFCAMHNEDGKAWGDMSDPGTSHLFAHFEEGYVVSSLVFNAIREAGYREPGIIWHMAQGPTGSTALAVRAVRRYLTARLLPAQTHSSGAHASGFTVR